MAAEPTMLPGPAPRLADGLLEPALRGPEFHLAAAAAIGAAMILNLVLAATGSLPPAVISHLWYLPVLSGGLVYGWRGGLTLALLAGLVTAALYQVPVAPREPLLQVLLPVALLALLGSGAGGLADLLRGHLLRSHGPQQRSRRTEAERIDRGMGRPGMYLRRHLRTVESADLALLADLQRALAQGAGLHLVFQPKLDLRDGRCTGAEALMRWTCPDRGAVSPGRFVPLAETTNLIRPLTEWVLRRSLDQLQDWQDRGLDLSLAVNISVRNLMQQDFVHFVGRELAARGLPPHLLQLEVTESGLMVDPHASIATLQALKAMGVQIAIDDFGTGHSSMAYLRHLPADTVKIDRSFIDDMDVDRSDEVIVRATILMARFLRLRVVAEGVENGRVYDKLRRFRCDEVQGYHIARPMPAAEFAAWLAMPGARQAAL
ncbi:MAG: EAL domain-containing protein [Sneathiellaceae bacterium]